ncbi:MAG: diaminopimelate decarboxylase, partial [Chloroflexota bacterium]
AHYAGKAYLAPWLLRRLLALGMDLDACSESEMAMALRIGFPAERIRLHGNNKTKEALRAALRARIGAIVVDNIGELRRIANLSGHEGAPARIVLRLNPGIEAHTHEYLRTGGAGSKFGMAIQGGTAAEAVRFALDHAELLTLLGYHAHTGTQLLDTRPYVDLMDILLGFAHAMHKAHGFWPEQISPGGGPGITYTEEQPLPLSDWLDVLLSTLPTDGLPVPMLHVEPGRAVIGPAGVALYTVGDTKRTPGNQTYVLIDGGMADNIRPALYQAVYAAVPATRMGADAVNQVSVAGPFCESGDVLIREALLPDLQPGDLLAVPACGAYCLPMSSNYNGALRPAVVTVEAGIARLVQRRQTLDDLMAIDVSDMGAEALDSTTPPLPPRRARVERATTR